MTHAMIRIQARGRMDISNERSFHLAPIAPGAPVRVEPPSISLHHAARSSRLDTHPRALSPVSVPRVLTVGPDRELVAARIGEVKAPATWKAEDGLHDLAAGRPHALLGSSEIHGEDHHQDRAPPRRLGLVKPTRQPTVFEARVIRAVVREFPSEDVRVKAFRGRDVRGGHFDVIDAAILLGVMKGHVCSKRASTCSTFWPTATTPRWSPGPRKSAALAVAARRAVKALSVGAAPTARSRSPSGRSIWRDAGSRPTPKRRSWRSPHSDRCRGS